ncbi:MULTISPECIES: hypothetical protein [Mycobacterium ulcerans group]|uniref:Membrane protein n=3 Tax=Mycobacterium TaxID=1763 RepID=L7VD58_MYCL1|nr:hypothetical protein [Mycobacterium pseudoshottsii]AGC64177.1 putative membrane protein [Mycobacterium liflandii 128FXT]EPQ45927.1 hypothetical protein MMSP_1688 [Mycobacterium sp. 012931]EPQ78148.1 hypothetical protein MMMB2_2810 [Mycobacterium marinum MB2]MBC9864756.1 hypothetical protein [Mycobacterium pseudoshottsii]BEH78715.1 hypothetical protein YM3MPS_45180 [Mycobacterium pseudoshottsii]
MRGVVIVERGCLALPASGIAPADRRASGRAVSAQTTVGRCVTMSNMAEGASARAKSGEDAAELRKESYTMALYVAVCLLAALLALPEAARHHLIGLIWGITIGLAAAHFFAFKISARLIGAGKVQARDIEAAGAQLVGAAVVAALASVTILVLPAHLEYHAAEFGLSGFIAVSGYAVARRGGAGRLRATVYGLVVLILATAIAVVKNVLAGH